ncbi:hypothetical protein J14TS2_49190 [Bacillus sp. J14TS2]|uniref:GNAT family N-acetyltransferase n=1 Tax=Bacillus sp. J14TS2 TaxID=2807188 RepID=UPI001B0045A4|nr:GNAT family N-acetyltransferase [Bacillus sp. J14TS2]GIN74444.1 hypothetical protein J14TS2_49190 [Bacillus sp. J14TS2]
MKWRDYDIKIDKKIDAWILPSFSDNANLINKYAFFHEPISQQYIWYKEHPSEGSNIANYFKVVEMENEILAFFILNYFKDDHERLVLGINPMAIHPQHINQGYGTLILSDLITNTETIIGQKVEIIYAGIDEKNAISTNLFLKFGFKEAGRSPDKKFIYYELKK